MKRGRALQDNRQLVKDSLIIYIGSGLQILFALLVGMVRPKLLGPDQAGLIAYVNGFITTTAVFFSLGFDASGGRVVLRAVPEQKIAKAGNNMRMGIRISLIYTAFVVLLSAGLWLFDDKEAARLMIIIAPFASFNILFQFIRQSSIALGSVWRNSLSLFGQSLLYLPLIYLLNSQKAYHATSAIFFEYSTSMIVALLMMLGWYRAMSRRSPENMAELKRENKSFGMKVYLSRIITMPTFNLDTIILGATHPFASVSFYSITGSMSRPVQALGDSVSQSLFRKMYTAKKIPGKLLVATMVVMTAIGVAVMIAGTLLVRYFLGDRFQDVLLYLPWMILVSFIRGITTLFHQFLSAKGAGDAFRRISYLFGGANLVTNLTLIPPFGVAGCVMASAISLLVNLAAHIYYYQKQLQLQSKGVSLQDVPVLPNDKEEMD